MHLGRDFQAQCVEPDEARGVVLVVGFGRVGFYRGVHGNQFTPFSGLWQLAFVPARPENQCAV